jgi:hypothetical protein
VKENGRYRFTPDEWLTTKQIKSFFSTLTQTRRKKSDAMATRNKSIQKQDVTRDTSNNNEEVEQSMQQN